MLKKAVISLLFLMSFELVADEMIPFEFYNQLELQQEQYQDKNELKILSKDSEGIRFDSVEGSYWSYEYNLTNVRRKLFIADVKRSIHDREGTILFQGSDYLFFKLYNKKNLYWGKIVYYKDKYSVELVREGAIVQSKPQDNIVLKNLQFDSGKATLKKGAEGEIMRIVQFLTENPSFSVEIQGHTDSVGNPASNLKLSQDRAQTVTTAVVEAGVDSKRLRTKGYGDQKPIANNRTKEGQRANRRVELKIIISE